MLQDLTDVAYGPEAADMLKSQHVCRSAYPFDESVERLKKAIEVEDLWLIHEINPKMLLAKGGYGISPSRQLLFFHPRYMSRLLALNPAAIVEVPLKLVVMQMPRGGVVVRFPKPTATLGRYPQMADLASELMEICERLVDAVDCVCEPPEC